MLTTNHLDNFLSTISNQPLHLLTLFHYPQIQLLDLVLLPSRLENTSLTQVLHELPSIMQDSSLNAFYSWREFFVLALLLLAWGYLDFSWRNWSFYPWIRNCLRGLPSKHILLILNSNTIDFSLREDIQ